MTSPSPVRRWCSTRILFLSTWCPLPPDNGSRIRAYHLLRALASAHEVTAVVFDPERCCEAPVARFPELGSATMHRVAVDPFRYTHLPQWVKYLSPLPVSLWPAREMRRIARSLWHREAFDAVVAVQSPVARYALMREGPARILDMDTALAWQMRGRHVQESGLASQLRTWTSWQKAECAERALLRRFHVSTVVSAAEVTYLRRLSGPAGARIEVIPNGVDCTYHRPGIAAKQPGSLVYNGALTYSANYDAMRYFVQDVFPLVHRDCPDIRLRITGSTAGVDLVPLEQNHVEFTGYVQDIRPIVAGSAVCVVPLRQGGGTRLKILEAMALGTAVVSTSKGAEGLDVMDGVHLLIADDPAAFASATRSLLQDAGLRDRLVTNARRLVEERYDWREIGGRFVSLVEGTVARVKGSPRCG